MELKFDGNPNPKIEKLNNTEILKESIFNECYVQAVEIINEIVNANEPLILSNDAYDTCYNNVVIFEGDRGTGKTSCMLSLAESYKNCSINKDINRQLGIKDETIFVSNIIDPSILDKENIIEILVANMLEEVKKKVEREEIDDIKTRKIIKAFEEVFGDLKIINNDRKEIYKDDSDNLENLLNLSSSVNLRKHLKGLVNEYLSILGHRYKFLMIQIDDLDLNIRNSTKVIEEIRKYLIIPNIIIMISVKLDQCRNMLYENNKNKYNLESEVELVNITEKYLEKILPNTHIITMPDLLTELEKESILYKGYPIEKFIIKKIYDTTGYKFVKPRFGTSTIIPKSLREMNIFINFIENLSNNDDRNILLKNFKRLERYYINTTLKISIDSEDYMFITKLYNNRLTNCNDMIIEFLINRLYGNRKNYDSINHKLKLIMKIENSTKDINNFNDKEECLSKLKNLIFMKENIGNSLSEANVNIGKVLRMFQICENYFIDDYDKEFLCKLKLTYSMMLYKTYFDINVDKIGFQKFIAKDIYDNWEDLYDIKKYLYKLKTKIRIDSNKKVNDKYVYKDIRSISKKQELNLELYKMKYLLYNLVVPFSEKNEELYLIREDEVDIFDIPFNQQNFYFNGTMALTNIFYSNNIFSFIETNNKDISNDIVAYKENVTNVINEIIDNIPFYNIEFMTMLLDKQVKRSNKARVKGGDLGGFTIEFIKEINDSINEIMKRTVTTREGNQLIYSYSVDILMKLPCVELLELDGFSSVINNLIVEDEKNK